MDELTTTLLNVLQGYTGKALNGYSYLTSSADDRIFTVVSVGHIRGERIVDTGIIVQRLGDQVVIEHDVNDKTVLDALLQAGVPREQIVLAYNGEIVENIEPA